MTLEDLKNRCKENNIQYAYGNFNKEVKPPFLVAYTVSSENFKADDIIYFKSEEIELTYTYVNKDRDFEKLIEEEILKDVIWNKTSENFLSSEELWQVSYYFKI